MPHTYTLQDLHTLPTEASTWVVDNLFRTNRKRCSVIAGLPEAGKSTLAMQLAKDVAQGRPFLGRNTIQGKVIYWQSEEDVQDTRSDFLLNCAPTDPIVIVHPRFGEDNAAELNIVLNNNPDARLCIIETLDDFLNMEDVKNNDENRRAFARFDDVVIKNHASHCAFVVLHWLKKSDTQTSQKSLNINRLLGATAIGGKTDAKIYLHQVSDTDQRRVVQASIRKGKGIEPTYLDFNPATMTSVLGQTVAEEKLEHKTHLTDVKQMECACKIVSIVRQYPDTPKNQVVRMVGGHAEYVSKCIDQLIQEGQLACVLGGEKRNAKLLRLGGTDNTIPVEQVN